MRFSPSDPAGRAIVRVGAALCLASPVAAMAQDPVTYSLSRDWSDTVNPFVAWTLKKSPVALFEVNQEWWPGLAGWAGQLAWVDEPAPGHGHVPMWARYTRAASPTLVPGDIVVHTAEIDRTGTDTTSVVWTAPSDGSATIVGEVWCPNIFHRQMRWELRKNGAVVSQGVLISDGTITRTSPFFFERGSGGPAALMHAVGTGDQLELAMISLSEGGFLGELAGLRLEVVFTADACYADCDDSGALDFFDFLCFQNLFGAGDPLADCDGSGGLDFFDFLCFQNEFGAGCP